MGASATPNSTRERVRHVGISNVQLDAVIEALDRMPASQRDRYLQKGRCDPQASTTADRAHGA